MRYYLACGVGGIATAVHTTQFEIRDVGLYEPILATVVDEIEKFELEHKSVIVRIAGVCGMEKQVLAEASMAKKYGFDVVLLSPGGLSHLSEDEMIERTKAVAKIMPVIGFYLQPSVGGRHFSYRYWESLAEIDNVVAIKAAPFNQYMTLDLVRAVALSSRNEKIALYTGNDDNIVIDLITEYKFGNVTKSFVGGLLGHWSVWTKKAVSLFHLAKKRVNIPELLILANEATDANAAFFDTANGFAGCIPGLHEVLRRQGLLEGIWCLNPDETLSPGQMEEINRVYQMYPHLNDDEFVKTNLEKWLI
jgi:dihydrodipicolinate synthase/N-acetylneuraminate lyase